MPDIPCLICGRNKTKCRTNDGDSDDGFLISKQLNVIFILKYLLNVPSTQLQSYLEKCGNPDSWISLCDNCAQLTGEARSLHSQILKVSSKLKYLRNKIVETTKRPVKSPLLKLKTVPEKMTVWKETRSFVQKHNYATCEVTSTNTAHHQQCPNCFTQIQIQLPPQLQPVIQEEDAPQFHQCLYCTTQFPSITSVMKHIQTVHEMQRLPCLHPGCDATLKNMKNFWEHRQRHKSKKVAASTAKTPKILKNEEPSSNDDSDNGFEDRNYVDNQDDVEVQNAEEQEDTIKITTKKTLEDVVVAEEESDFLEDPAEDFDDLQDNLSDKDNDWLPEEEEDRELDVKPVIDSDTPKVTQDTTACFSTIIKGGTRTVQQCPRCPLKFPSISSTLRHLSTTHHLKKLPCLYPGCTSALSSIKGYFEHRKLHLYPQKKKVQGGPRGPHKKNEEVEGPCLCDLCGASFKKKDYLNRHKRVVHLKSWESIEKKVTCHICGIPFRSGYLKKHILFIHKGEAEGALFQCEVVGCKLFFIKQEGLDKHMDKKHKSGGDGGGQGAAVKQLKCSFCGKGFCFKRKLDQHELSHKNQQLGIKPFVCEICGKGFGVPQNLANHLNYTHKLAKKFQKKSND